MRLIMVGSICSLLRLLIVVSLGILERVDGFGEDYLL